MISTKPKFLQSFSDGKVINAAQQTAWNKMVLSKWKNQKQDILLKDSYNTMKKWPKEAVCFWFSFGENGFKKLSTLKDVSKKNGMPIGDGRGGIWFFFEFIKWLMFCHITNASTKSTKLH